MGALNLHKYLNLNWHQFSENLDSLREHFWSARVVEWTVIGGTVALTRRGLAPLLLFGGWFWAFLLIKGTGDLGSLETGALLRMLMPAIPAFVVMVAALPLLLPGVPKLLRPAPARPWGTRNVRTTLAAAAVLLFAVLPVALAGAANRAHTGYVVTSSGPIPIDGRVGLRARAAGARVELTWSPQHATGAPLFYEVLRAVHGVCPDPPALAACAKTVALTRRAVDVDAPPKGEYDYWILVGANWLDDPSAGDEYVASKAVTVTVP
jgi:hypothetical protein